MPAFKYVIVLAGWLIWTAPFLSLWRKKSKSAKVDRRARWGIVLQAIAFALLWQAKFWEMSPPAWRIALSIAFFLLASLLSWTATRALGRQWRIDAGLNADHKLVTSGPYRFVRHPIYASMLCLMLGMGFMVTPLPLLAVALLLAIAGTEIRVRIEDALLSSRFGAKFDEYRHSVAAYVPLIR